MKLQSKRPKYTFQQHGDTIVEVLIAIAIAAFAIGISYSTAQRSLQQAISAREHNQALDILENQVADLNYRFKIDGNNFNADFASKPNFCLGDNINTNDPTHDPGWRYDQSSVTPSSQPTVSPYNSNCQTVNGGAHYFANISPSGPVSITNQTVYAITVRWYRLGGGINQASIYYKLNNSPSAGLSYTIPATKGQPMVRSPVNNLGSDG